MVDTGSHQQMLGRSARFPEPLVSIQVVRMPSPTLWCGTGIATEHWHQRCLIEEKPFSAPHPRGASETGRLSRRNELLCSPRTASAVLSTALGWPFPCRVEVQGQALTVLPANSSKQWDCCSGVSVTSFLFLLVWCSFVSSRRERTSPA